jgi:bifunctional DNA-binding transcriptional regulator/antitoxin component of YhaV-PrlF toxin-antitoxin module
MSTPSTATMPQPILSELHILQLRDRGQITLPIKVRKALGLGKGDIFTLVQFDSFLLLTPRQLVVPRMADTIARLAEEKGLTLNDLLTGLEEVKVALFEEKYGRQPAT